MGMEGEDPPWVDPIHHEREPLSLREDPAANPWQDLVPSGSFLFPERHATTERLDVFPSAGTLFLSTQGKRSIVVKLAFTNVLMGVFRDSP
jgi:hypothetical protein